MAIVQPDKLLVDYPLYKTWNGFVIPKINDEDRANGITTPELKYQAWAIYTQNILNVVLQEELDNIGYDLDIVKPGFQRSLIKIMITRLIRAFSNDQILPRDAQVQLNQQGGIQYSSAQSFDAKSALYSFFNGPERAMIETSGLLEDTFSIELEERTTEFENQFKDGVFVPDVNWGDKQDVNIVLNGTNTTIIQALNDLNSGKLAAADLAQAIQDATGLDTDTVTDKITVLNNKYIEYTNYRNNKGENEVAQVKDVNDAEARGRADIVTNQKNISKLKINDLSQDQRIEFLEALEATENIIDIPDNPYPLVGTAISATFDIKSIKIDDPANPGTQIQKFNDFSDGTQYTIELFDPAITADGAHQAHTFRVGNSGTYTFAQGNASDTFRASISNLGILTIDRVNGNTNATTLTVTELSVKQDTLSLSTQNIVNLINQRVKSQIAEGANADFQTFAELKALLNDDDFVAISFAAGETVTGRVSDNGDPLIITGFIETNGDVKWGSISIANDLAVTGGVEYINKAAYIEKDIKAVKTEGQWKDITATYQARVWKESDIGNKVRITSILGVSSGLISATGDTKLPKINIHLGTQFTDPGSQIQLYYSTEKIGKIGTITFNQIPGITVKEDPWDITKFEIWEVPVYETIPKALIKDPAKVNI